MYISILLLPEGNERTRIQTYVVRTTEMKNEEEEEEANHKSILFSSSSKLKNDIK
jgi:hypothetical protein